MKTVRFEFDASLIELLPRSKRRLGFEEQFTGPQTAKHLIEALGVPHTEIGALSSSGRPVALEHQVCDGETIKVEAVRSDEKSRDEPRFVLDGHLGKLNSRLRMLGLDCAYGADCKDQELAETARRENRALLTRDRRLLMRKSVSWGYLVRSLESSEQLVEVTSRFKLAAWFRPFRRCIRCNQILQPVRKSTVLQRLEPLTRLYYHEFHRCPGCGQIYWNGSHVEKMLQQVTRIHEAIHEPEVQPPDPTSDVSRPGNDPEPAPLL